MFPLQQNELEGCEYDARLVCKRTRVQIQDELQLSLTHPSSGEELTTEYKEVSILIPNSKSLKALQILDKIIPSCQPLIFCGNVYACLKMPFITIIIIRTKNILFLSGGLTEGICKGQVVPNTRALLRFRLTQTPPGSKIAVIIALISPSFELIYGQIPQMADE